MQASDVDITSFVIRFITDREFDPESGFRGTIRHVQSNRERSFKAWEEAVGFIREYVRLDETAPPGPKS